MCFFNHAQAQLFSDPAAVHALLSGNSISGTYTLPDTHDTLEFKQVLQTDGIALVAIKGQPEIARVPWFINAKAEYCETWPDHQSCFKIGKSADGQLIVEAYDQATISSTLHQGAISLTFP